MLDRLFLLCYSEECYIMARYAYYAYAAERADVVINKIKKNPCIRTRRTGDYMIINAQGNTKKLNRCMIDAKIPADQREKL